MLGVDNWPDEWLVRVSLIELGSKDYVPRFRDLFYAKVSWSVKLVLSHYDLSIENDGDLIFRWDYYQVIFFLLYDLNFVHIGAQDLMVGYSLHEGENLQVFAEVLEPFSRLEIRVRLRKSH